MSFAFMEAIAGNVGNGFRADIRDRLRKLSGSAASQLGPRALALATYLATADVLPKTVNESRLKTFLRPSMPSLRF